ncbi:hypothetical protein [Paludisphaera rhizosphaerae]|uniref:hypothetical protein n=1 Tax=Paludisphaera rhizosphaerae TaxID=2711216 RepID=UPI0013EDD45C|nr:hypothetical protein [Paludisphaera rhizosphaerae]
MNEIPDAVTFAPSSGRRLLPSVTDPLVAHFSLARRERAWRFVTALREARLCDPESRRPILPREALSVALAAGEVYAIEHGDHDYESLAGEVGKEVADLVAEVTPDPRLSMSRRRRDLAQRVIKASDLAKVVKLAEVGLIAEQVCERFRDEPSWLGGKYWRSCQSNQYEVTAWADHARDLLDAMSSLFTGGALAEARHAILADLQTIDWTATSRKAREVRRELVSVD